MELEGEPKSQITTTTADATAADNAAAASMKKKNHLTLLSSPILNLFPSLVLLLLPSPSSKSATSPVSLILHLVRHVILLSLRLFLLLLSPFLQPSHPRTQPPHQPHHHQPSSSSSSSLPTCERALAHVLSLVSLVPVASRKYELIRTLADRLLEDNLRFSSSINREALSLAFRRTLGELESTVVNSKKKEGSKDLIDAIVGMVRAEMRRWTVEEEGEGEVAAAAEVEMPAEKMVAEVLWLAGKMAECGAVQEAVRSWGEAEGLARVALTAEPKVQVAFVRVSAFLFKQANAKQFGRKKGGEGEEEEGLISHCRMAMLKSWLPLLCRATNGTDSPVLSSGERARMVKVLEEMIEKLRWEEQEEVLSLWLHHFTSCPESDWPNLESCYTRWYSKSRDLCLK